jgi:hypothetical protein
MIHHLYTRYCRKEESRLLDEICVQGWGLHCGIVLVRHKTRTPAAFTPSVHAITTILNDGKCRLGLDPEVVVLETRKTFEIGCQISNPREWERDRVVRSAQFVLNMFQSCLSGQTAYYACIITISRNISRHHNSYGIISPMLIFKDDV